MTECRICRNAAGNRAVTLSERMYGSGEAFDYFQCAGCGCLQINAVPEDLGRYYESGYYSFKQPGSCFDNAFKAGLKRLRTRYALGNRTGFAKFFLKAYRAPEYFEWLVKGGVSLESDILDIGCGSGELLVRLSKDGFASLTGLDAFIPGDINYENGVRVYRQTLAEHQGRYDFIMLHHSFEHMPDPLSAAGHLNRILRPGRYVLVRVPVVSAQAWTEYGPDWAQLDAPRHLYLHTEASMRTVAQTAGFQLKDVVYDSDEFQFWGSEQYRRGIALQAPDSLAKGLKNSIFTRWELEAFKKSAAELNAKGAGDQACFYLYKP